jgi:hypothetical protein
MCGDTPDETIGVAILSTNTATSMENQIHATQERIVAIPEGAFS